MDGISRSNRLVESTTTHGSMLIDRVKIEGSSGTIMTKPIYLTSEGDRNPGGGAEFWIDGTSIVTREFAARGIGLWRYPAGGRARVRFHAKRTLGLTISTAKW